MPFLIIFVSLLFFIIVCDNKTGALRPCVHFLSPSFFLIAMNNAAPAITIRVSPAGTAGAFLPGGFDHHKPLAVRRSVARPARPVPQTEPRAPASGPTNHIRSKSIAA